jgi:predicted O-methyltransferase YrrM
VPGRIAAAFKTGMIERIQSKLGREIRKRYRRGVPLQQETTFVERDTNWYEPCLAGPSTFMGVCSAAETVSEVMNTLRTLTPDRFVEFNLEYYQAGLVRFGPQWKYADILTVLLGIGKMITVKSYLEIGVRRGRSMAMVASRHPSAKIVGFDLWMPNYVGIENPGPEFVLRELERVGYQGPVELVSGNSRETVPRYFQEHPAAFFDLITVDGDHSASGARMDVLNVIPRLKVGGFLVFDDICNPYHPRLSRVWERQVHRSKRFMTATFEELGYGVGFAIKKY